MYLIMRKNKNRKGEYSTVPGSAEEAGALPMASLQEGRNASRPDVIYDEGEESKLMGSRGERLRISSNSVAFHSGFLDDDEDTPEDGSRP